MAAGVKAWPPGAPSRGALAVSETVEEVFDFGEETGGFRLRLAGGLLVEFGQQLPLALGELLRRLDQHLHVHVAGLARAQHRHALAAEAKAPARMRALGHFHFRPAAVDGRHFEAAAERRRHHRDRHAAMQVGAVALEELVRADRQEDVEIARRPAAYAGLALAGKADAGAVLDAGRHVHRKRAFARDAARARAVRARIVDHLAAALAGHTRPLQREEALRVAHLALPAAGRAGLRPRAGLGARARAGLAGHRGRN